MNEASDSRGDLDDDATSIIRPPQFRNTAKAIGLATTHLNGRYSLEREFTF